MRGKRYLVSAVLFTAFVAFTLYMGRDIPAEDFEEPVIRQTGVRPAVQDSIVETVRIYSDGDIMLCRYIVDPRHRGEAIEYLRMDMVQEQLDGRGRANMELRRHHIRRFLGCRWEK